MADVGVRPARRADAAAVADIQVRAWRHGYRDLLPDGVLDEVTGPAAVETWRERWAEAAAAPPSPGTGCWSPWRPTWSWGSPRTARPRTRTSTPPAPRS